VRNRSFLCGLFLFRITPAGNFSPIVSYSAWLHGVSCPQETVGERFPVRLDSTVFLTDRKLFAKGFLFGLIPQCFLSTGNCLRRVSYSAWLHGVSYRQETVREGFPVQLGSMVFLAHRKLFVKGFLYDMAPWYCLPTGNCWRKVSYSAWLHAVSCPQETVGKRFPVRLGSMVFLAHRKLFAKGFLFGLAPWRFLPTGNCLRRVSHSAWLHAVSCPQETVGERFPVRLGSMLFLTYKKLFAKGFPFGLAPCCSLPTGNCSRRVSCPPWLHGAPYLQETFHSPSYPCKLSSCRGGSISLYLD